MAVVNCKECGGQVSTKASACPSCGAKQPKRVGLLGWAFVLLFVLPLAWQFGKGFGTSESKPSAPATPAASKSDAVENTWRQSAFNDAMTDAEVKVVSLRSENATQFEFPYNSPSGSRLTLTFRRKGAELDAYFRVDKGQMLCGISDCKFSLRVGEGSVQQWTGLPSSTNDSDLLFVRDAGKLEEIVKKGGSIRVGIDFYRAGTRAFDFNVAGYPGV